MRTIITWRRSRQVDRKEATRRALLIVGKGEAGKSGGMLPARVAARADSPVRARQGAGDAASGLTRQALRQQQHGRVCGNAFLPPFPAKPLVGLGLQVDL